MYFVRNVPVFMQLYLLVYGVFINPDLPIDDYASLGDLQLVFMAPLYLSSDEKECRAEFFPVGLQNAQGSKWAVDKVNANSDLLPNITLGIILMNDCARGSVALARSTQILPRRHCYKSTACKENFPAQGPWPPDEGLPVYDNVIGVIGPSTSTRSVLTASLFAAYNIPQISPSATSDVLSDKASYPYFSRVIPPDQFQAQAMVSILVHFNWTYISTLNLAADYGRGGIGHVITHARKHGICIAYSGEFQNEADDSVYDNMVDNLAKHPKARVVILYMHEDHIRRLYLTLDKKQHTGRYIMIAPDAFVSYAYNGIEHLYPGTFAIQPKYAAINEFKEYFETLPVIRNETANYWEGLYTEDDLNCVSELISPSQNHLKRCSDFKKVTDIKTFSWSELISGAIDAVFTFAYALDNMIRQKCPAAFQDKSLLSQCINGKDYLKYVRNVSFDGYTQHIEFDENGDILGGYDITYFRERDDGTFGNIVIGGWSRLSSDVDIDESKLVWYFSDLDEQKQVPESVCAKPCGAGEYFIQGEKICCWQCRKCREYERIRDDRQGCETCPMYMWPNQDNLTSCTAILPAYMKWTDTLAIGLMAFAAIGILGTVMICLIFVIFRDKKVIRGSSRELMAPIIFGMLVAFLTVFTYLTPPTDWSCYTNFFAFHLSCTFIFGPLFLKTLRMYRIFAAAERCETRVPMVSGNSQVGFTLIILLLQLGLSVGVAIFESPGSILKMPVRSVKYVEQLCNMPLHSLLIPLSFNMFLLILCAVFGFLTRKLPDNFNESWYIFISVATTIFIWIAFLPTYIMAFYAYHKAALLSFVLILNSSVMAACLQTPKIYALFFIDESKIKVTNFDNSAFSE